MGQNPALESLFTLPEKPRVAPTSVPKQNVLRARRRQEPSRYRGKQGNGDILDRFMVLYFQSAVLTVCSIEFFVDLSVCSFNCF